MSIAPRSETWRELLGRLTALPTERQRVAELLGVNAYTVTRWINDETEPRASTLKKLPDVFPSPYREQLLALIQADFFPHMTPATSPPVEHREPGVPAEYLARALSTYATTSGPFRAWSLRNVILQFAIKQLDPDPHGMEISVVQCVPPAMVGGTVRSLCKLMGVGTAPWEKDVGRRFLFLGAESLAGWTVGRGEPGVVQDMEQLNGLLADHLSTHEQSAVAWPFQREGKLAGCLLVSSTQKGYFTPMRLSACEIYANALALSFRDEEFYPLSRIALHEIPVFSQEYASIVRFRERVAHLRSTQRYRLSEAEAEVLALQQIEVELLDQEVH